MCGMLESALIRLYIKFDYFCVTSTATLKPDSAEDIHHNSYNYYKEGRNTYTKESYKTCDREGNITYWLIAIVYTCTYPLMQNMVSCFYIKKTKSQRGSLLHDL
jgi:hypothetical protein